MVPDGPRRQDALDPRGGSLRSNNLSALLEAARAGMGLAALPWYVAHGSMANGAMMPVLEDHALPAQDTHAVLQSPRLMSSKVTSLIDVLRVSFAGAWWRDTG